MWDRDLTKGVFSFALPRDLVPKTEAEGRLFFRHETSIYPPRATEGEKTRPCLQERRHKFGRSTALSQNPNRQTHISGSQNPNRQTHISGSDTN